MQRRKLLKTIAAGGALSLGVSGGASAQQIKISDIEELKVMRNDNVVGTIENPSDAQFKRLDSMLDNGEVLYVEEDCSTYCSVDCDAVCSGHCTYTHTCSDTQWCCA